MNRVVVTGIGMVSPLASNVNDTWDQLLQSKSGINRITSFNTSDLNVKIAGQIPRSEEQFGFNAEDFVETKDQRKIDDFILWNPKEQGLSLEGTPDDPRFAYVKRKK